MPENAEHIQVMVPGTDEVQFRHADVTPYDAVVVAGTSVESKGPRPDYPTNLSDSVVLRPDVISAALFLMVVCIGVQVAVARALAPWVSSPAPTLQAE